MTPPAPPVADDAPIASPRRRFAFVPLLFSPVIGSREIPTQTT